MKRLIVFLLLLFVIPCQAADQIGNFVIRETVYAATGNISANDMKGSIINNYGQANDAAVTLPTIAQGYYFDALLGTTVAKYYRITAGANDKIYLDGVAGSDGGYVGIASAVAGATISCRAFQTGASAFDWYCGTASGNWVAGP